MIQRSLCPLSISLAHKLNKRLTQVRKGTLPLYPDGESQVTIAYNNQGKSLELQML
ncbi:MAG: hypothetical protein ACLTS6_06550 [Anaerobutyricum sp.]